MHDPVGLLPVGSPSLVEDERLPHADEAAFVVHRLVPARRLPEPGHGGPVGPRPRWVLAVLVAEEVPLVLLLVPDPAMFFSLFDLQPGNLRSSSVQAAEQGVIYIRAC